jgi:four helix bundle protein
VTPDNGLTTSGWVGMNTTKNLTVNVTHGNLYALELAVHAAGTAIALVDRVPTKLRSIQDQVIRSASSVPANLAEGHGRSGRDRHYHYRIAFGSAKEVDVHLRILLGAGTIDRKSTEDVLADFDQVRAMLWRLMHPKV